MPREVEEKVCRVCGRRFGWRRKWARDWARVKHCSKRCAGRGLGEPDHALERAILDLLSRRSSGASICPSEAARAVGGESWRGLMEPARMAARRLAEEARVEITQRGRRVDPSDARGPIRIRVSSG